MLVCTLPSPACMCSATNTRPCSTRWWIASRSASSGTNGPPAKMRFRSARSSCFHETRIVRSCSRSNTRSARFVDEPALRRVRDLVAAEPAQVVECGAAADDPGSRHTRTSARGTRCERLECLREPRAQHLLARQAVDVGVAGLAELRLAAQVRFQRVEQLQLVRERELDVDALDGVRVLAESLERDHHVFVDLERVGVARDGRGLRAVAPERLARLGAGRREAFAVPQRSPVARRPRCSARRRLRRRRRCRRSAPSSAARRASTWSCSRRPSGTARRGARGRRAARRSCGPAAAVRRGSRRSRGSHRAPGRRTRGRPCGCAPACDARSSAPT